GLVSIVHRLADGRDRGDRQRVEQAAAELDHSATRLLPGLVPGEAILWASTSRSRSVFDGINRLHHLLTTALVMKSGGRRGNEMLDALLDTLASSPAGGAVRAATVGFAMNLGIRWIGNRFSVELALASSGGAARTAGSCARWIQSA